MSTAPRQRKGRLPVLGLVSALALGSGSGLTAFMLLSAPAGADTTLGGFTVTALAEASTGQYEQPNLPIPATPTAEFDEGYAATTDNYGPTGSAVASTVYPGQVIANSGPEAGLLFPGAPIPPLPLWPVEATSNYPQTPNSTTTNKPGVNMEATSTANANTATATIGNNSPTAGAATNTCTTVPGAGTVTGALGGLTGGSSTSGSGNPAESTSSLMGISYSSGTSTSGASGALATASASATDSGISILAGLICIGSVTSTATATSDGTTGKVGGSTVVSNVVIAGQPATVDTSGIHAAGNSSPGAPSLSVMNTLLFQLGMTMTVTNPTDVVKGAAASRTLDGLRITINLTTLDAAANKFSTLLPASFTSQLPLPIPNSQQLTMDLGTVSVSSTASPAFIVGNSGAATSPATTPTTTAPLTTGSTGNTGNTGNLGSSGSGITSGSSFGGTSGTPGTSGSGGGTGGTGSLSPTSAITPVFGGIGAGLILLGIAAAALTAYGYRRVDDLTELEGLDCVYADPQIEFFTGAGQAINNAGGIGA
jgi:hypothetical protein